MAEGLSAPPKACPFAWRLGQGAIKTFCSMAIDSATGHPKGGGRTRCASTPNHLPQSVLLAFSNRLCYNLLLRGGYLETRSAPYPGASRGPVRFKKTDTGLLE